MTRQPRVLLCCEHYPPSVGGVQEVMRQIAERLAAGGVDVTVATSPHPDRLPDSLRNGVRVVSFAITGNWAKGMDGPIEEYRAFLRQGQFDALLIKAAQQWTFDAAIDVMSDLACRKLFIPCGFSGLNDPLYAAYFQQMPLWLAKWDGLIFYANEYQDIAFARAHGLAPLHLIPNGVDEREFADLSDHAIRQRLGIDPEHDLILSVGSQLASKGHWELVRAFGLAHLHRPSTLVINANSPGTHWKGLLKRHVKHAMTGRWPLSWLARWHGRWPARKRVLVVDLPRSDLVDLYKSANLFVLASHVEYSPLVLFEAAAAGTAFLSTAAGNSQEIAQWTGGGTVMPRARQASAEVSPVTLAREMENMLADPQRLRATGQAARAAIWRGGFTWDQIVAKYRQLLLGADLGLADNGTPGDRS
jgi:glycosyltransferase involved in cell wall biosynthesis